MKSPSPSNSLPPHTACAPRMITSLPLFPAHVLHTQRWSMHAPHSNARRRRFGRARTAAQNCSSTGVANLIVVLSYLPRAARRHRTHAHGRARTGCMLKGSARVTETLPRARADARLKRQLLLMSSRRVQLRRLLTNGRQQQPSRGWNDWTVPCAGVVELKFSRRRF